MYLSTVLDDYPRYIIAWNLCASIRSEDGTDTLDMAWAASGCNHANVLHRPRLLSDKGNGKIAGELAEYTEANKVRNVRGAPFHPQSQGKIERWHQTLNSPVSLEKNYLVPGDLEQPVKAFVEHYNHQRYHDSLDNVTPMPTSAWRPSSSSEEKGSSDRHSIIGACNSASSPPDIKPRRGPHSAILPRELCQVF